LAIWTWTCSEHKPIDWSSDEWRQGFVSSSSEELSSSSEEQSSSSSEAGSSSSGEEGSSSSEEELSSSSEEAGSSSSEEAGSSSSEEETSSSSKEAGSSSSEEVGSSSSEEKSSSSEKEVSSSSSSLLPCGTTSYDPETHFCYPGDNKPYELCGVGKKEYNPTIQECRAGAVRTECGSGWYDAETHFCQGGNEVLSLCGAEKKKFTIDEFCTANGEVLERCNGATYNPSTQGCCNNATYSLTTHSCYNNQTYSCDNKPYDPNIYSCHNNQTYSCDNKPYNPVTQFCSKGKDEKIVPRCGSAAYNGKTHFCYNSTIYVKCNGSNYDPETQFCSKGSVEKIVSRCGSAAYNGKTHFCHDNVVYAKCDGNNYDPTVYFCHGDKMYSCNNKSYNPVTQFCFNDSKVGNKCGINPQTYDPDLYTCKSDINPNGVFLIKPVSYEGENYEAVLIGTQIWMAKNLNYNVSGSRCFGDYSGDDSQNRCGTYGRLYSWSMAMNIDTSCDNKVNCGATFFTPHQGICPEGWHLPNDIEWATLLNYVGTSTKLKAKGGWSTAGTDDYGFSALPSNVDAGTGGWWSSTPENSPNITRAYFQQMRDDGFLFFTLTNRSTSYSVRCVKD
jgi:uncharacterized protein (TIGR02145 family)